HRSCHIATPLMGLWGTGTDPPCQRHGCPADGRSHPFRTFWLSETCEQSPSLVNPEKPLFPAFPERSGVIPEHWPSRSSLVLHRCSPVHTGPHLDDARDLVAAHPAPTWSRAGSDLRGCECECGCEVAV